MLGVYRNRHGRDSCQCPKETISRDTKQGGRCPHYHNRNRQRRFSQISAFIQKPTSNNNEVQIHLYHLERRRVRDNHKPPPPLLLKTRQKKKTRHTTFFYLIPFRSPFPVTPWYRACHPREYPMATKKKNPIAIYKWGTRLNTKVVQSSKIAVWEVIG